MCLAMLFQCCRCFASARYRAPLQPIFKEVFLRTVCECVSWVVLWLRGGGSLKAAAASSDDSPKRNTANDGAAWTRFGGVSVKFLPGCAEFHRGGAPESVFRHSVRSAE